MIVRWLGHAAFSLDAGLGPDGRICIDPHAPGVLGGRFRLPEIVGPFAAIATTHSHEDHCAWRPALGCDRVLDHDQRFGPYDLRFRGISHDTNGGREMGWVRMMSVQIGAFRLVHAGDIGAWSAADVAWLRDTDLLLVPVGGTYTLDGLGAARLVRAVQPRWVMPMHGQDPLIDLPLAPATDFIAALDWPVARSAAFSRDAPPPSGRVVLLQHPVDRGE